MSLQFVLSSALEQFDVIAIAGPWWFSINNIILVSMLAMLLMVSLNTETNASVQVGSLTSQYTLAIPFILYARSLFNENLQMKKSSFFYFLFGTFFFILASNVAGMVPFSLTVTSFIAVTLFFSSMGFFASLFFGIWAHGWYFFELFIPAGTPTVLKGALVFIELVSYTARLFSLAIRLFANMMAGHALLKILSSFGWSFLTGFPNTKLFVIAAALSIIWMVTILEVLIAGLQAYVYIVLTSIYLHEAVNLH